MGLEIERRFLVGRRPADLEGYPRATIVQGYVVVAEDGTEVRLRQQGERFTETVKSGEGATRAQFEIGLTPEQFGALWPYTAGRRIQKDRYAIAAGTSTIEVDVYHGALEGLVTAEVEFESAGSCEAFQPPEWFGLEVTDDRRYNNQSLALYGLPVGGG
jgi:adenylate cyclase